MQEHRRQEEYDYYDRRPSDLDRLGKLDDWHVAEGEPDIRGWSVLDQNEEQIGKIDDLLVSTDMQEAIFAIVSYGDVLGIGGKETLVPLDRLEVDENNKQVFYRGSVDEVHNSPQYSKDTRDYGSYYDYWTGGYRTGAEKPRETERHDQEGRRVIPEVEEHLEVGKREEQVGEVEVRKEVETHRETTTEPVKRTRVHVFRRQVEPREVQSGEQTIREGETIRVPVVEEKLVTEKRAEVTGEVVVEPEMVEEEEEVTAELRKEHVEVERHGDVIEEEEEEEERSRRM